MPAAAGGGSGQRRSFPPEARSRQSCSETRTPNLPAAARIRAHLVLDFSERTCGSACEAHWCLPVGARDRSILMILKLTRAVRRGRTGTTASSAGSGRTYRLATAPPPAGGNALPVGRGGSAAGLRALTGWGHGHVVPVVRVAEARRGSAWTGYPRPGLPGGEDGGRRRARLGGGAGGRSAQPAVLRAARCASGRPAHRVRLPLAGLPAGGRGRGGRRRGAGGKPLPGPERLEHRDHRLRGLLRAGQPAWARRAWCRSPVSALLVFLVGRVTPGYGADRIIDTLIGAAVAVIAVHGIGHRGLHGLAGLAPGTPADRRDPGRGGARGRRRPQQHAHPRSGTMGQRPR